MVSNRKDAPIIIVEGNIGAGKSTFLKILKNNFDLEIIFEPTDKWQQASQGGNLLNLFYKDTPRWAYTFQSYAFITRIQALLEHQQKNEEKHSSKFQILERSVYCDRYCFAKNCFESGLMTELEWHIYKEWFSWLVGGYTPKPSGFIYLQTTPERCFKRMAKRNRSEEAGIPLDYLKSLHNRHEDWLVHKKEIADNIAHIPVLTLDCDKEFEADLNYQKELLAKVDTFINQDVQPIPLSTTKQIHPTI